VVDRALEQGRGPEDIERANAMTEIDDASSGRPAGEHGVDHADELVVQPVVLQKVDGGRARRSPAADQPAL
jgi:hypothetical protein